MPPETVASVIETAAACWQTAETIEITLEANPTSVEAARLAGYRSAGVGRLSLGVQSFEPEGLTVLGREHSVEEAIEAIAVARSLFERVSFDLIYARPGQTRDGWRRELATALDHAGNASFRLPAHHRARYRVSRAAPPGKARIAAGGRTGGVLRGHPRGARRRRTPGLRDFPTTPGPGDECRHNLIYWLSADYIGVGPGAHGRVTLDGRTTAFSQRRAPEAWREAVECEGYAVVARDGSGTGRAAGGNRDDGAASDGRDTAQPPRRANRQGAGSAVRSNGAAAHAGRRVHRGGRTRNSGDSGGTAASRRGAGRSPRRARLRFAFRPIVAPCRHALYAFPS